MKESTATGAKRMSVAEVAALGWEEARALAKEGKLSAEVMGVVAEGGLEYFKAIATGDIATPDMAAMRVGSMDSGCIHCPSHTISTTDMEHDGGIVFKVWCGKSLRPAMEGPRPTCGCLVGLKINGKALPGPKVWVGSEKCPQGLW